MSDPNQPSMDHRDLKEFARYMCGKKLGSGAYRDVYVLNFNDDYVVKIERDGCQFQNIIEWQFWEDHQYKKGIAKWLAPCASISEKGTIMIQKRTTPILTKKGMPAKLPKFLGDCHIHNFGKLNGKVVCHDYAINNPKIPLQLVKKKWYDPYTGI